MGILSILFGLDMVCLSVCSLFLFLSCKVVKWVFFSGGYVSVMCFWGCDVGVVVVMIFWYFGFMVFFSFGVFGNSDVVWLLLFMFSISMLMGSVSFVSLVFICLSFLVGVVLGCLSDSKWVDVVLFCSSCLWISWVLLVLLVLFI